MEASLNQLSNTLEPDWPQHDRHAAGYRAAVFFRHLHLIPLSLPHEKFDVLYKNVILYPF
jgi:hypothetical protein